MRTALRSHYPIFLQLLRFGITGGAATLTQFFTVVLLVEFTRLHPLSANAFGFSFGFIVSFTGHRFWTFSGTDRLVKSALPRFFLVAMINFTCNQGLYSLLLLHFHLPYTIALIMVLGIMASITFLMSKFWVFR